LLSIQIALWGKITVQNLITSSKLARHLCVSKSTINRMVKLGKLPFYRLPSGHRRFDLDEIKKIFKENDLQNLGSDASAEQ